MYLIITLENIWLIVAKRELSTSFKTFSEEQDSSWKFLYNYIYGEIVYIQFCNLHKIFSKRKLQTILATSYIYIATHINEWKEGKTEGNKIDGVLHEKVIARLYTTNTQCFLSSFQYALFINFQSNYFELIVFSFVIILRV